MEDAQSVANSGAESVERIRPGLAITAHAAEGDPRELLVELSRDAHLVVIGSRGRGVFRSRLLGSVSANVESVNLARPHGDGHKWTHGHRGRCVRRCSTMRRTLRAARGRCRAVACSALRTNRVTSNVAQEWRVPDAGGAGDDQSTDECETTKNCERDFSLPGATDHPAEQRT